MYSIEAKLKNNQVMCKITESELSKLEFIHNDSPKAGRVVRRYNNYSIIVCEIIHSNSGIVGRPDLKFSLMKDNAFLVGSVFDYTKYSSGYTWAMAKLAEQILASE
jgi:hypothetical protein